jgi:hypothetical protein
MSNLTEISVLYREFTDALAEILAENVVGPARRGRLARARATVKRHPQYSEHEYFLAVEAAFAFSEPAQEARGSRRLHRWQNLSARTAHTSTEPPCVKASQQ